MSSKNTTARLLFIVFCSLSLVALTSCDLFGGGNTNQPKPLVKAPPAKQIYTVPETEVTDFDTLDPALAHDIHSINAIQMIFTGLVSVDDKLRVHPQLAESWEQSSSGTIWTFHLKPHLTFSDGTPLTSADVAYSIDRALQPATQSTVAPLYLGLIKDSDQLLAGRITTLINDSLLTPNPNTLVILTKKKAAYFLPMLTSTCSYVVEKSLITLYGAKFTEHLSEGGGAGPFKVAQYIHRQVIDFVPNANYYDAKPQLQKVRFVFYHSTDEAYLAYQRGQIDMTGVPMTTLSKDRNRKDFFEVPQLWINYYTMNYLVKPFDNIHIRQAFALAIDKTAIANTAWLGTVLPTNHIVPQGMDGYNPNLTGPDGTQNLTGNAKEAQQLLQQGLLEEKWSDVSQMPAITLTYAAGIPAFDKEVSMMIDMWQKVLKVTVVPFPIDYNTLLDKVTAATNNPDGLQFWGLAWVGEYPDPQDWLTLQFDKGVPNNNMNYGQNTSTTAALQLPVQRQLETADTTMQADARLQMYQQAEQQLVNDVAWMPMEQVTSVFLRTPYIVGIVDNAQGSIPPNDWATIYRVQ
ncbi:MAG TPA: peptide ABC transporter substrate-binding protein [Ktedonobacteraceae bacterium]|nr:peptide ABC transporter substrate-binding protein [Ktedonobacteraceae bacterium]